MKELTITTQMAQAVEQKATKVAKINELCNQLVALEIKERNARAKILEDLTNSGEKLTEKVKTAKADKLLKSELGKIAHLKNQISNLRREIEVCNDRISLARNIIRELEITK